MKKLYHCFPVFLLLFFSCVSDKPKDVSIEIHDIENGLLPAFRANNDTIVYNITERMEHYKVPGVSMALVENGKIKWAKGYGIANTESGSRVDANTIFQAGSISKPVAALAALKLVEEGKMDLDKDVNAYLKDWKIPASKFTEVEKVTLRRLLTHTAGVTVHGFPGYQQTDTLPSITQVLNGVGNTSRIGVDTIPGSTWRYSGGGYTIMQKLVEEVSGRSMDAYLTNILEPMGMTNSTFEQPLPTERHATASAAYGTDGKIIDGLWHNYPEKAAAGLWTTPTDLAKYALEIQRILAGKQNGVLKKETVQMMLTKHSNSWGLGPSLQWESDSLIFRHGGKNAGFTNEMVAFANRGNAIVVMTNADNGGKLIGEILRSVSHYYNWGISEQRVIDPIALPTEYLKEFVGTYKLNFQVPNIGDYLVHTSIKDNQLVINDPNNGEVNTLMAIETSEYIDLDTGDKVIVKLEENKPTMTFNGRFKFFKIE